MEQATSSDLPAGVDVYLAAKVQCNLCGGKAVVRVTDLHGGDLRDTPYHEPECPSVARPHVKPRATVTLLDWHHAPSTPGPARGPFVNRSDAINAAVLDLRDTTRARERAGLRSERLPYTPETYDEALGALEKARELYDAALSRAMKFEVALGNAAYTLEHLADESVGWKANRAADEARKARQTLRDTL